MKQEKFNQNLPEREDGPETFPPEIIEQFKNYIRLEHPINLDKTPATVKNHELLNSAKIYLKKAQKEADKIMTDLEEEMKDEGTDVPKGPEEKIEIYPCFGFFEKGRLFVFWINCPAQSESVQGAIRDRKSVNQDVRISYPVSPFKLPKHVGIYRELTFDEIKKGVEAFGENYSQTDF